MLDEDEQPLIAVRIKDGIFVGNVTAAHDEDFLFMNKVTHIINCAGHDVRDLYESTGIEYLTYPWRDATGVACTTVMFDSADRNIDQATKFIDKALDQGECVLVHSYLGVSRSCALVAAYLMMKYGWKVDNALSFMAMAHQDMNIKPHFMRQLRMFAKRHDAEIDIYNQDIDDSRMALDNDQLMLRNTYLNGLVADEQQKNSLYSQCSAAVVVPEVAPKNPSKRRRRITFCDTKQGTAVANTVSTPVVSGKSTHVDPGSGVFTGHSGLRTLRLGPSASILARRGEGNTRKLESPPDVNAKGRQVLVLKPPPPPPEREPQVFYTTKYSHLQEDLRREREEQFFRAAGVHQQPPSAYQRELFERPEERKTFLGRPMHAAVAPSAATTVTERHAMSRTTDRAPVASMLPPKQTTVRSPFSLGHNAAPRKGSPLPQPRASLPSRDRPGSSSNGSALRQASPQAVPSFGAALQAANSATRSNNEPPQRVIRTGSPQARTSSPDAMQRRMQPSGASSPIPHATSTFVATSSPRQQVQYSSSTGRMVAARASSPMSRPSSSQQTAFSRPTGSAMQRTSSPIAHNSPRPSSSSLADQYLGMMGLASSSSGRNSPMRNHQAPSAPYVRETNASIIRRQAAAYAARR